MGKYLLAIDCGLTNCKMVLFDTNGERIGLQSFRTPLQDIWLDLAAIREKITYGIRELLDQTQVSVENIAAIGLSGHGNGAYFICREQKDDFAVSSMFSGNDVYIPATEEVFPIIGQTSWSGQPLSVISWIKRTAPHRLEKVRKVVFCKDYIRYLLTGEIGTEYSDASAGGILDIRQDACSCELLKLYGLEDRMDLIPSVGCSTEILGEVSGKFAEISGLKKGTPVVGGMFDVDSCMVGTDVTRSGIYSVTAGTWGINAAVSEERALNRNITQCCIFLGKGNYVCVDSAPTSCSNLMTEEVMKLRQGISFEEVNAGIRRTKVDPDLLFLPYAYQPMDLKEIRGGFVGRNGMHSWEECMRAVYEGIVFEHTRRIQKLRDVGICNTLAHMSGGGAGSETLVQMLADAADLTIRVAHEPECGALGGAVLASVAAGFYGSVEEASKVMVKEKLRYEPQKNPALKEKYLKFMEYISSYKK